MVTVVSTTPHASVVKETICRNCGSTLQYVPADIKKEIHRDYGGGSDTYYHIVCPPCGDKVNVKGY
jgi:DNA-directed RNA polymerase subunit RPC12/RpoP